MAMSLMIWWGLGLDILKICLMLWIRICSTLFHVNSKDTSDSLLLSTGNLSKAVLLKWYLLSYFPILLCDTHGWWVSSATNSKESLSWITLTPSSPACTLLLYYNLYSFRAGVLQSDLVCGYICPRLYSRTQSMWYVSTYLCPLKRRWRSEVRFGFTTYDGRLTMI